MCWPESQSRSAWRWTTPTTTGRRWRRPIASSEKRDHQARNASRVQARASQPVSSMSGECSATVLPICQGYSTMMPSRTCRGALQGNDRATGANANTSARSATPRAASVAITSSAMPASLISTRRSSGVGASSDRESIEGERRSPANRGIVRDDERPPVRRAAHVDLDAGNARIAGRSREGRERILLGALAPATMGDELHDAHVPRNTARTNSR